MRSQGPGLVVYIDNSIHHCSYKLFRRNWRESFLRAVERTSASAAPVGMIAAPATNAMAVVGLNGDNVGQRERREGYGHGDGICTATEGLEESSEKHDG